MAALTSVRTADDGPTVVDPATFELQVLIAEARRRRNARFVRLGALALFVVIALIVSLTWPHRSVGRHHGHGGAAPARGVAATRGGRYPRLVWVTSDGRLIIGDLHTLSTRVVAGADVDISSPLVPSGGLLYWIKQGGGFVDGAFWPRAVEALNPATGRSIAVAPGEYLFTSATGAVVYAALTDTSLTELPSGRGRPGDLTLPAGWFLPGGQGIAVAGGIIVTSRDVMPDVHPAELAIWNPATGGVRPIGRGEGAIAAYTPRGAGYSLLAWMPANCRFPSCPITITNTATLASRTLRSPLGHGFVLGGAFSPDGRRLAVFASLSVQAGGQKAELAIASTATGAVHMVAGVQMMVGEDSDWIRWLPGGTSLITQASRDYLVNTATLAARPFRFTGVGQDVNFSAELIPATG